MSPPKKKSKKKGKPKAPRTPAPEAPLQDTGVIKQGTIAKFMRKRTQLVGFETGLNKHTQYAIEFLDNAIDALESWWWKTKRRPRLQPQLDPKVVEEVRAKLEEGQIDTIAISKQLERDVKAGKEVEIPARRKESIDERITEFRKFLMPLRPLLTKREPLCVIELKEVQMPDLVPIDDEEGFKVYEFTCFDTGVGMV
ncbi:MAG: hypothetical protein PVJ05_06995, partial [Candidatus Thorarchaeota archaeon]